MCDPVTAGIAIVGGAYAYNEMENAKQDARDQAQRAIDEQKAAAAAEAERQRKLEEARQARIQEGRTAIDNNFSQFNDQFYSDRSQAYQDYAMPELDSQYKDSMRKLVAALARSGNLQSSVRAEKMAALDEDYAKRKLDIQNTGTDYANSARNAVDKSRADLITQNMSLADPNAISANALANANSLAQMPTFSPLGTMLADVTSGLASQADLERRGLSQYNTGLFTARDSGRVVS
jgi:hypothetical protein